MPSTDRVGAKKNRGTRLCRGGFPYNLMKSLEFGGQCFPLPFDSPPLSLIDDTKVQDFLPVVKYKIRDLLVFFTYYYKFCFFDELF